MATSSQHGWRAAIAATFLISEGAMKSLLIPEQESLHALAGVARTVAISGSQSDARRNSLRSQYSALGIVSIPELIFFEGVSGTSLEAIPNPPEGEVWFQDTASGLQVRDHTLTSKCLACRIESSVCFFGGHQVRLWDWTVEGLGGAGMDLLTVARITACACSHILAARDALAVCYCPCLVARNNPLPSASLTQDS